MNESHTPVLLKSLKSDEFYTFGLCQFQSKIFIRSTRSTFRFDGVYVERDLHTQVVLKYLN